MATIEVLGAKKYPFEAAIVKKAGSLFTMNLFYFLDRNKYFDDPHMIEESEKLHWVKPKHLGKTQPELRFCFFRHPADRFAALYFDNIYYEGKRAWNPWRNKLQEKGFNFEADTNIAVHQKNAKLLLDMIDEKIEQHGLYSVRAEFAPQMKTVMTAQDRGFIPIDFAKANIDLPMLMRPYFPKIDRVVTHILSATNFEAVIPRHEFITGSLEKRLHDIYATDYDFYEAMRYGTT